MWKRNKFLKIKNFFYKLYGKKTKRIPFNFEIHLTNSCNLNCKGCFHFSPLAKSNDHYPIEQFEKDINRISELFDGSFRWVNVLGGEPLLNNDIEKYLDILGEKIRKGKIKLITNGIKLLSMPDSFYESCVKNNIIISITKYPIPLDYDLIVKKIESFGCKYEYFGNKCKNDSFMQPSLDKNSKLNYKDNYLKCKFSNVCITLEKGYLYYCTIPAFVYIFNEKFGNIFDDNDNGINIYTSTKNEIVEFLRIPHHFCKYCDLDYRKKNKIRWEKSNGEKEEWEKRN